MASAHGSSDLSRLAEGLSSSDLDMGFCLQPSLSISALEKSANTIHFPKEILVEFSNISTSTLDAELLPASSPIMVSPSLAPQQSPSVARTHALQLPRMPQIKLAAAAAHLDVLLKSPVLTSSPNLSSLDLSATNASWEVSQIKPVLDGPEPALESTELELTWSPRNRSGMTSVAEISSLVCSATTPPVVTLPDGQRSWKETLPLGPAQEGTQSL